MQSSVVDWNTAYCTTQSFAWQRTCEVNNAHEVLTQVVTVVVRWHTVALPTALQNPISRNDAIRFLQRATFGARPADVDRLVTIGVDAWFTEQFNTPVGTNNYDRWFRPVDPHYTHAPTIWEGMFAGQDQLRKRVAYALSQILVVSRYELDTSDVLAYADVLEAGAFGTFRNLLEKVTLTSVMGQYLTYQYNRRASGSRLPDENYAREIMQLFSIGLWQLDSGGVRKVQNGQPIPSYDQNDILGLARVFTGWGPTVDDKPERSRQPMIPLLPAAEWHEPGTKVFLGVTIPVNTNITDSLRIALDTLANHPNTAPFICKQLIQRLVTSNPSSAYVTRVTSVWASDSNGQRGNLFSVVKAILTDADAWVASPTGKFGKLREPVLRFTTVTRALGIRSTGGWPIDDTENAADELAQQPYLSPSVFNFYRPGYVPPQSDVSANNMVGPEFQIADETSCIGWVNFLSRYLRQPNSALSYTATTAGNAESLLPLAANPTALVDEVGVRLCAGRMTSQVRTIAITTVTSMPYSTTNVGQQQERVLAAALLIAASTDFLYER
jgi:uncharacterized protein (DUF1800 family)